MNFRTPVAIPWYESERDYLDVVAMLPASEGQDPISYDAFMSKVQRGEQEFNGQGVTTVRVPINAATLKGWCDENNLPICRQSINEYGMIRAVLILKRDARRN